MTIKVQTIGKSAAESARREKLAEAGESLLHDWICPVCGAGNTDDQYQGFPICFYCKNTFDWNELFLPTEPAKELDTGKSIHILSLGIEFMPYLHVSSLGSHLGASIFKDGNYVFHVTSTRTTDKINLERLVKDYWASWFGETKG